MNIRSFSYFLKGILSIAAIGSAVLSSSSLSAQTSSSKPEKDDVSYKLSIRDQIEITLFDEADLSDIQRIDGRGQIQLSLIGTTVLSGMTLRDAEDYIESLYIKNRILRNPKATVRILEYAPKEISVLGAVGAPGRLQFPAEVTSMDIIETIAQAGGFTELAKRNAVRVTRNDERGQPVSFTVKCDDIIRGRATRKGKSAKFLIYPGDIIYVSDRFL